MQFPKQSLIDVQMRPQPDNDRRLTVATVVAVVVLSAPPVVWSAVTVLQAHTSVPKQNAVTMLLSEVVVIMGALVIWMMLHRPTRRRLSVSTHVEGEMFTVPTPIDPQRRFAASRDRSDPRPADYESKRLCPARTASHLHLLQIRSRRT
jgi:HAMP domain-containing protein